MFDIGGWEFLVIVVLAIVIIGPKDLPATLRTVTLWARKARSLARDFHSGLDDLAREVEMDDVKNQIGEGLGVDEIGASVREFRDGIENTMDPTGEIGDDFELADHDSDDPLDEDEDDDEDEADDAEPADGDRRIAPADADGEEPVSGDDAAAADADGKTGA